MVFGQSREEKLSHLQEAPKPKTTNTTGTNTLPVSNIGIVNLEQKKKPYDVKIKNHNPQEPKINPNIKYSAKQSYRRYKTKKEPNLLNKIQVNEDDDIVNKIKEAFGIKPENADGYTIGNPNTNYSEHITAPSAYNNGIDEPPIIETKMYSSDKIVRKRGQEGQEGQRRQQGQRRQELLDELDDVSMEEAEDLTSYRYSPASRLWTEEDEANRRRLVHERVVKNLEASKVEFEANYEVRTARQAERRKRMEVEAVNILKHNIGVHLSKKRGVKEDFNAFKNFVDTDGKGHPNYEGFVLGTEKKKLDLLATPTNEKKRNEKYSMGLDYALPTPSKETLMNLERKIQQRKDEIQKRLHFEPEIKESGTSWRGRGRPTDESYRTANPSRFSTGEMTNPLEF